MRAESSFSGQAVDCFYRYNLYVFLVLLILALVIPQVLSWGFSWTAYQNATLTVACVQAVIVAYISFRIFDVGKRDSELSDLSVDLVDVEELDSSTENHRIVRCTAEIRNHTFGRANIMDMQVVPEFNRGQFRQQTDAAKYGLSADFSEEKPTPAIIDKGDPLTVVFQINGSMYLTRIQLRVFEEGRETRDFNIQVSDIQSRASSKKNTEDDTAQQ